MPIVQINWENIKDRLGDVTALYALTHRQAGLLLSLSEQFSWEKTFRVPEYDWADKDDLDLEIDDTRLNLAMPVNLTDIIQYIDEIETILTAMRDRDMCCGNTVALPQPGYESDYFDEFPDGTPPSTWGDSESVADGDDWVDLVCGAAHNWIDLLKTANEEVDEILTIGVASVSLIAGVLGAIATAGIGAPIAYALAAGVTSGLVALGVTAVFEDGPEDIEAARSSILCSVLTGGPEEMSDAVQGAVDSALWLVWYQFIDYENVYNVLIDGTNGDGTLAVNRGEDCECEEPQPEGELSPNYHWRANSDEWTLQSPVNYTDLETTVDGFDIDGIISYGVSTYPQSHTYWKSDNFDWPGGKVDIKVRARSTSSGTPSVRITYVVVNMRRASDDALLDAYSTQHTSPDSDYNWSEQTDYSDDTDHSAQEVYLTVAIDGTDGYGGRYVDYVSCRVRP